jgi:methyl-accepting chemotaxis protein
VRRCRRWRRSPGSSGKTEIADVVASTATEQAAATEEITRNVQQAAQGAQEVAGNVQGLR